MGAPLPERVDLWLAKAFNVPTSRPQPQSTTPTRVCCVWTRYMVATRWSRHRWASRDYGWRHWSQPHMKQTAEPRGGRVAVVMHQLGYGQAADRGEQCRSGALTAGADARSAKEESHA